MKMTFGVSVVVVIMIKRIKSYIYGIKLKYYIGKIKAEMMVKVVNREPVDESYMWKRLNELLNKGVDKSINMDKLYVFDEDWN